MKNDWHLRLTLRDIRMIDISISAPLFLLSAQRKETKVELQTPLMSERMGLWNWSHPSEFE